MEQRLNNLQKALNRVSNVIEDSGTRGITVQEISYRLSMNLHAVKTQVGILKKAGKITQQGNICKWVENSTYYNGTITDIKIYDKPIDPGIIYPESVNFKETTQKYFIDPKKWLTFNLYKEKDVRSR